jgi:hypothetical protein
VADWLRVMPSGGLAKDHAHWWTARMAVFKIRAERQLHAHCVHLSMFLAIASK